MNDEEEIEVLDPISKEVPTKKTDDVVEDASSVTNNTPLETSDTVVKEKNSTNNKNKFNLNNKKLLIIVGCSLLFLVLFIALIIYFITSGKPISRVYNPDSPILINKNGKYGYIDSKGKVLIKPKYEFAYPFYGDYALVVVNDSEEKYNLIDKKGNVKLSVKSQYDCTYIPEYDVWEIDRKLYNGNLKQLSRDDVKVFYSGDGYFEWSKNKENTVGIMKYNGKVTFTYKNLKEKYMFSMAVSNNYKLLDENYCVVGGKDKKSAIVNCETGKVVYDYGDYYVSVSNYNIFTLRNSKTFKFISTFYIENDKLLYESTDQNIELKYYSKDYLRIQDSSKTYDKRYTYYNLNTKKVENKKPDVQEIDSLNTWQKNNNISEFSCDKGVGLKKKNKKILACEWSDIDYFDTLLYDYLESKGKGYIIGEKNNKHYLISTNNMKEVSKFDTNNIHYSSSSTFIYYVDNGTKKKVIYNLLTGKEVSVDNDVIIKLGNNYSTVTKGSKVDYYNTNLELIYTINNKK